ncbi:MAG TPA: tail fiber domain-containing protein [Candidatus Udaeobacter sp.]|jgi:hypothetical protein|nr:tail fiber domain-containing protein [Candidatus Udaeobacter sp.]
MNRRLKLICLIVPLAVCVGLVPIPKAFGTDTDGALPSGNNADGIGVLTSLTSGAWNSGFGYQALNQDTIGSLNTATGLRALFNNTEGNANTANGMMALFSNTTGENNVAVGAQALVFNIDGDFNTAVGTQALTSNTSGSFNTANGAGALFSNTEGSGNTANGFGALVSNTTGALNTALGAFSGNGVTTANNVICIGADGENVDDSCYIGQIYSNVQPIVGTDPDSVTINSSGRLGRGNVSSRRYKHDIMPMEKASEALYALKPVSFRYNKEYDATQTLAFGLIAEEVAEVYPDLVGRNSSGEPESVRYEQINAMLLNEFLKEHRKVEEQQATITELKKELQFKFAEQQKQIKALASGLEKVSAQLEVNKLAPQMEENNP